MEITFLGATDTVTGSKYLARSRGRSVLVDCGLFQGLKRLRLRIEERLRWTCVVLEYRQNVRLG